MQKNDMHGFTISSELLIQEAKKRGARVEIISLEKNLFTISKEEKQILCKNIDVWLNTSLWYKVTEDKELTYTLLEKVGVKVPKSLYISEKQFLEKTYDLQKIVFPCVVKPIDGAHGDGVTVNISTVVDLQLALEKALAFSQNAIVQEYIEGDDYRFLVVWEKVVAVALRIPPFVTGDGKHTIQELIAQENLNPLRWKWNHTSPMSQILVDSDTEKYLKDCWYTYFTIPLIWEIIYVRWNANLSTWGISLDVTDKVHPSIKEIALLATKATWLQIAGVDIMTKDIQVPLEESSGAVIEINSTPWLRMHHFPSQWNAKNVVWVILDVLWI